MPIRFFTLYDLTLPRGVTPRDLDCFGRESVRDLLKQLNY